MESWRVTDKRQHFKNKASSEAVTQCVLQYQVSCSVAGTLHRVKRSQPKISDNPASHSVLGGTIPIRPEDNCREREAQLSHHWQTPLLFPAPTDSESWLRRHCPWHWEIHKPLQHADRMEVMFSLSLMEEKSARVKGSRDAGSVWFGECFEDGTLKGYSGYGWCKWHAPGARSWWRDWSWKLAAPYLP